MRMYLLALKPTDSVTEGFLPAAARLGLDVTLLTDRPEAHRHAAHACAAHGHAAGGPGVEVLECDVRDFRAVLTRIATHHAPDAVFTNSDHLQTQAALAADWFGLPGKPWKAALCAKDKAQMRRRLAASGAGAVRSGELAPGQAPETLTLARTGTGTPTGPGLPYPCVVKPREGVASEDVFLVEGPAELVARCAEIRARRPGEALVAEEYLAGRLCTLETLGDGRVRHVLGGFRTELSPPPYFVEERMTYVRAHPASVTAQVLAQLDALGVGFGACHTEFVVEEGGRVRLVEVNYRAVGDQCDLLLAELLDVPLFERILRTHLGEPLPDDPGTRDDGVARLEYPCADRAGTLTAAPGETDRDVDGVRLRYRPLRALGERHPLHHTNRDFLGVVRATGTDQRAVDRAVTGFLAAHHWEITP